MNEEIKEILEDIKRHLDYVEATKQCSIRDNEMKAMYNYITNLQKELDQYKNNWEELKKYIENFPDISYASSEKVDGERLSGKLIPTTKVLNKMKELEEE